MAQDSDDLHLPMAQIVSNRLPEDPPDPSLDESASRPRPKVTHLVPQMLDEFMATH